MKSCSARNPGWYLLLKSLIRLNQQIGKAGIQQLYRTRIEKGWLGFSRAEENDIIREAERRLYILLFTKVVCQDDPLFYLFAYSELNERCEDWGAPTFWRAAGSGFLCLESW